MTHDGGGHLARFTSYAQALRQGQLPPRWAPTFWDGYGYPIFNYYYPLPNILALPFLLLPISIETVGKIILILLLVAACFGIYLYLRIFIDQSAIIFGVLIYLLAPFLFTNLYVRGAFGELAAYAILPYCLLAIEKIKQKVSIINLAILYLIFILLPLSHNILGGLIIVSVLIYAFFRLSWNRKLFYAYLLICLGITTAVFFWLPMILEQRFVTLENTHLVNFNGQFPNLKQLFLSGFSYGRSDPQGEDTMSFGIGYLNLIIIILALISTFIKSRFRKQKLILLALIGVAIFLMTPYSLWFWQLTPKLQLIQFPWRLLGVVSFLVSLLGACLFYKQNWYAKIFLILLIGTALFQLSKIPLPEMVRQEDFYYQTYSDTSTFSDEVRPVSLTINRGIASVPGPITQKIQTANILKWNGSYHLYEMESDQEVDVTENTAYFPGWQTKIDDQSVEITYAKTNGLISYTVPPGKHLVKTRFTQQTTARLIGNSLSLIALVITIIFLLYLKKNRIIK